MAIIANENFNINEKKAIIFDWDGTLYNNIAAIKTATKDVLNQFEINYPVDNAVEEFLDLMEEINTNGISEIVLNSYTILNKINFVKNLPYTRKLELLFLIYSTYKKYSAQSQLFNGTVELLNNLSKKFDLALFTSSKRKVVLELLEKFGIKDCFKSVLSMDDVQNPKPNPEGIMKAISELNYGPDKIIYVGDLKTDILAARAANISSIAVYNGLIPKQELLNQQPDLFCEHITELTKIFNVPDIQVDKKADLEIDLEFHAKKIKSYVREEFNFFNLLNEVFPKSLEAEHVNRIIMNPLGFIGAIIEDGITRYTRGEYELSSELDVFSGMEEDLLRCLGLIIIHFVNERSNNLIKRIVSNQISTIPSQIFLGLLKISLKNLYPEEYRANFKRAFLGLFQNMIPEEVYYKLKRMDSYSFSNHVLEGAELGLIDLGLNKPRNFDLSIGELAFRPFNIILKVANRMVEGIYDRFKEMATDILENDFRELPKKNW